MVDDRWPPPYGDGDETRRIDRFGQQHQQAPSGSSWRNPRFWGLFTGIVAITIVAVVAMFFIGIGEPADEAQQQSGGEVFLEPVASTGRDPFTPPVSKPQPPVTDPGTDPLGPASPAPGNKTFAPAPTTPADTPAATPTTSVRTANGDLPGLYGGTRDMTTCDPELLITFLAENPDKGRAWAGVHGITPEQIPDYVRALTPVLLRTDTRVTNHGFKDGRATVLQSVLQEGTAVMVDAEGVPRVRCECGNPLREPVAITGRAPAYVGERWAQFAADKLVVITAAPAPVERFVLWQLTGPTPGFYGRNPGWPMVDVAVAQPGTSPTTPPPPVVATTRTPVAPAPTYAPQPTRNSTPVPTHDPRPTDSSTPMPTHDPRPTESYTPEPTPTYTPEPTPTYTPEPEPTYAPRLTPTYTPEPAPTYVPPVTTPYVPEPTFEQPR